MRNMECCAWDLIVFDMRIRDVGRNSVESGTLENWVRDGWRRRQEYNTNMKVENSVLDSLGAEHNN